MSKFIHADVWRLAAPMILSNLTIPLLGMVDTAVMGHLSQPYYLGAVAIGGLVFSFIYWSFGFLRMGTTGLTAQAHGKADNNEIRAILGRALLLGVFFALLILLLQSVINSVVVAVLQASAELEHYASEYFFIRIWSAPAALMNYVLIGWFLGMQNARGPLWILLVINSINIVLDLVFVMGLQMDVVGVALASVIAEYVGAVVGLWLVASELNKHPGQWLKEAVLEWGNLRHMLLVNKNIFIRTLCLMFSFAFFTAQGARHGDVILAANAVLMNFYTFTAYGLDGFANAAEALVGKAVGQKDKLGFKRAVHTAGVWSVGVSLIFMLVYGLFGETLIWLLTDIEPVRQTAIDYLPWLVVAPILSVWSYLFDGVFVGGTRSVEMRNTMLISTVLCFLPAWYLLQPWGNHGLWAALMVFMVARGITMLMSYQSIEKKGGFVA
jgi:MATE family multidrug resistance protein